VRQKKEWNRFAAMKFIKKFRHLNQSFILSSAVKEAMLISLVALIVAVAFNLSQPMPLPLFGFSPTKTVTFKQTNIPEITLGEAYDLYSKKKAVLVDARDPFSFEEGHIAGALNIYPDEIELHAAELRKMVSPGSVVITYCDGPQCPLSRETAQGLHLQGLTDVRVLADGWSLWLNAGYPVAKGRR
jgi:rhodanese-related sulfurtransferase